MYATALERSKWIASARKPIVKITGEFWAQTTDGDGNYNMFPFLEGEGAEVIVEPIGTWIMYMIHQMKQKYNDRKGIDNEESEAPWWRFDKALTVEANHRKRIAKMNLAERVFSREYKRLQKALGGGMLHGLVDQYELQRMGHPYYNSRARPAARDTWKLPRTSTTPTRTSHTWC